MPGPQVPADLDKDERLRRLQSTSPQVPATYWSIDDLAAAPALPGRQWYLRGPVAAGLPQRPVGRDEALRLWRQHPGAPVVAQEYLAAALAGAAYVAAAAVLIETVTGPSPRLLRGGERGARSAFGPSGLLWEDRDAGPQAPAGLLALLEPFPPGSLVEWIETTDGRLVLVDLRELGTGFLQNDLTACPAVFVLSRPGPGRDAGFPTTSLEHREALAAATPGTVTFRAGSPLAHVVVAAVQLGWSCRVPGCPALSG